MTNEDLTVYWDNALSLQGRVKLLHKLNLHHRLATNEWRKLPLGARRDIAKSLNEGEQS